MAIKVAFNCISLIITINKLNFLYSLFICKFVCAWFIFYSYIRKLYLRIPLLVEQNATPSRFSWMIWITTCSPRDTSFKVQSQGSWTTRIPTQAVYPGKSWPHLTHPHSLGQAFWARTLPGTPTPSFLLCPLLLFSTPLMRAVSRSVSIFQD